MRQTTTGSDNSAFGQNAIQNNTTGSGNVAVGSGAMNSNTTGSANIAIGPRALYNNSANYGNIAIGDSALYNNGTGSNPMDEGNHNIGIGKHSLYSNTVGAQNVALGIGSLMNASTANLNIAIGYHAMDSSNASTNIAIGQFALPKGSGNTENVAIGSHAMPMSLDARHNVAIGFTTMQQNQSGDYNIGIGYLALQANVGADYNTAVGYQALGTQQFDNSTGIGNNAIAAGANTVRLGNSAVTSIGGYEDWTNISDGRFKRNVNENIAGLDFINALRPVTYNLDLHAIDDWYAENYNRRDSSLASIGYSKEHVVYSGFIAQEVEAAAETLGFAFSGIDAPKSEKDFYGLRYGTFVVPLVKAVQELSTENKELRKHNDSMQAELDALKEDMKVVMNLLDVRAE